MTLDITTQEFNSVIRLDAPMRFKYWLNRVIDQKELWSLWNVDGWALALDDDGHELVPVWSHPKYAHASAIGQWENYEPKVIELSKWINDWIPGMQKDRRLVVVFPTPNNNGILVAPEILMKELEKESSKYE